MARITVYTNSILASLCSILGYALALIGLIGAFSGGIAAGIILIVLGFGLSFLASAISKNKQFKQWKKQIERNGLVSVIQNNVTVAIQIYNNFPCKKSLEYIRSLNPLAADIIANCSTAKSEDITANHSTSKSEEKIENNKVLPNMTPEQIRAHVFETWNHINWEKTPLEIENLTPYAEHLFDAFFYIPAVDEYYSVNQDGNYYHGYETNIVPFNKEKVCQILSERINKKYYTANKEENLAILARLTERNC